MPLTTERQKGAHLLRRFGLGASEAELDYYLRDGLRGAVDRLLDYKSVPEAYDYDLVDLLALDNQPVRPQAASAWWLLRMVTTRRPLQEKMALFWHDHFATSAQKVVGGAIMDAQVELLRSCATSDFKSLLTDVSKDPAMLFWLDNQLNVKGKPNENFAREVMELFTLGEGNYSEDDIKEAARAFTGWSLGRQQPVEGIPQRGAEFVFRRNRHDDGPKTVLGRSGNLDGDDVIDHLCSMPRTAEYMVTKIWEFFVYPKPEEKIVNRFSKKFRDSGLDVGSLLRDIMNSSEFYSDKAERALYKNPVDFVVVTLRQLGVGTLLGQAVSDTAGRVFPRIPAIAAANQAMKQMGMQLLYPPDVNGWEHGPAWVTSATMVARIQWADRLFGQGTRVQAGRGERNPRLNFAVAGLLQQDPSPAGIAKKLVSIFDAPLPKDKMSQLEGAAAGAMGGSLVPARAGATAAAVTRLIFAAPEFQFC